MLKIVSIHVHNNIDTITFCMDLRSQQKYQLFADYSILHTFILDACAYCKKMHFHYTLNDYITASGLYLSQPCPLEGNHVEDCVHS